MASREILLVPMKYMNVLPFANYSATLAQNLTDQKFESPEGTTCAIIDGFWIEV
jgi:hypothetical protein